MKRASTPTAGTSPAPSSAPPPAVSVVVRTKDRQELLREALASVAAQTCHDLEAIVVNDGGRDVAPIVEAAGLALPIRYLNLQPGRGRAAAANAGVHAAAGRFVYFLDDDDLLLPRGIEALLKAVGDDDAVVYGRVEAFRYEARKGRPAKRHFRTFAQPFDAAGLLFGNFIPLNAPLLPTEALRAVGGFDETLACFEDWDLFVRLADMLPFRLVDVQVAEYRVFGTAFIDGRGGQELQDRGRQAFYRKHWQRYSPEVLSRMQFFAATAFMKTFYNEEAQTLVNRLEEKDGQIRQLERALQAAAAPPVSVVVVNYNGQHHLERCLPALKTTVGVPLEILVVDNASSDGSVAWLAAQHPDVKLLAMPRNLGFGEANRRGIEAARHELVALLNNDTVVDPRWLLALLGPLQAEPAVAATCSVLRLLGHPDVLNARGGGMTWLAYGFDHDYGFPVETGEPFTAEVLFPTAAAMLMRKRDFLAVGGFDRSFFMYHEDVDLGWRWWIAGRRVLVCADSVVYHAFGGTTRNHKGLRWREVLGARHALRSVLKNYELLKLRRVLRGLAVTWWRRRAYYTTLHACLWNLLHLPGTLVARWRVQRSRKVTDLELLSRVIARAAVPPDPPELPRVGASPEVTSWVVSPVLRLGEASSAWRLGRGWYPRESLGGSRMRYTCGRAECTLKVAPGASGRLVLSVAMPAPDAETRRVVVRSNGGAPAPFDLPAEGWAEIDVAAQGDRDGVLRVALDSPRWVPHSCTGEWDFRTLGVGVREVRFVPFEPAPDRSGARVSVVVPTYNRWEILSLTLEALAGQSYRNFEVIVVDDGSTDGTWERLTDARLRLEGRLEFVTLRQENLKQGQARNNALGHATGELVLFLGDDIVPQPTLLAEHVARHAAFPEPLAVVGYTDWYREGMRVTPFLEYVNLDGAQFCYGLFEDGDELPYTCFYTSNVSVPRAALGERPFDPAFTAYGWEDTELGYRLARAGLRLVLASEARGRHLHPMSVRSFYARQVHVGQTMDVLLKLQPALTGDPLLPPLEERHWCRPGRLLMPLLLPVVGALDRLGVRLPWRLYRGMLLIAFWEGRRKALAKPATG